MTKFRKLAAAALVAALALPVGVMPVRAEAFTAPIIDVIGMEDILVAERWYQRAGKRVWEELKFLAPKPSLDFKRWRPKPPNPWLMLLKPRCAGEGC